MRSLAHTRLIEGGLGKEFLKAFALSGARSLAVIDVDLPLAQQACREIRSAVKQELGVHDDEVAQVNAWECDVTNKDGVYQTIHEIGTKFGGSIDVFVGAAGICENIPALEYPIDNFKRVTKRKMTALTLGI